MKRIVLTGGGTAGHVRPPNIALLPRLRSEDYEKSSDIGLHRRNREKTHPGSGNSLLMAFPPES